MAELNQACRDGLEAQNDGRHQLAFDHFSDCLEHAGTSDLNRRIAHRNIGVSLGYLNQNEKAGPHFIEAHKIKETEVELINLSSYYFGQEEFKKAVPLFDRLVAIQPMDLRVRYARAISNESIGNLEVARDDIRFVYENGGDVGNLKLMMDRLDLSEVYRSQPSPAQKGLEISLPEGFKTNWIHANDREVLWEYLPQDQTTDNWREMITIRKLARPEPIDEYLVVAETGLLDRSMAAYVEHCGGYVFGSIAPRIEKQSTNRIAYCTDRDLAKVPEKIHARRNSIFAFKILASTEALYLVSYEWQDDKKKPNFVREAGLIDKTVKPLFSSAVVVR
ncbi:tetratricopeptide repeat protein [Aestuariispira insulae]|uniref:tetratricopeptide repeat protein n=1 Tax=Aestuariispira insulae TaxID=1461337 RepID=UPI0011C04D22|nr:hypothetical protein [Aestuariispira insulae]